MLLRPLLPLGGPVPGTRPVSVLQACHGAQIAVTIMPDLQRSLPQLQSAASSALRPAIPRRFHLGHHHHSQHSPRHSPSSADAPLPADTSLLGGVMRPRNKSEHVTLVGFFVNVALSVGKGVAGVLGSSSVLLADALHSATDLLTDVFAWVALRWTAKGKDRFFPYGRGRVETLASVLLSAVLVASGGAMAVDAVFAAHTLATAGWAGEVAGVPSWIAMAAAVVSIAAKEILFQWTMRIARTTNSPILKANAWHHRSDALSSVFSVVGVGCAMAGWPVLDPICGVAVSLVIVRAGWQLGAEALGQLLDRELEHELLEELQTVLPQAISDVHAVSNLRSRRLGPDIHVEMTVALAGERTVADAHRTTELVEETVRRLHPQVSETFVRIVPASAVDQEPSEDKQ